MSAQRWFSYGMTLISRKETLTQNPPGPMEADLGRSLGDTEFGGDLVVGQLVDVAQHDHLAQTGRQLRNGDLEASAQGRGIDMLRRIVVRTKVEHRRLGTELG